VWVWEKHPGSLPGTQTKRASFEASAVVDECSSTEDFHLKQLFLLSCKLQNFWALTFQSVIIGMMRCLRLFVAGRWWVPVMHQTFYLQQKSIFNYGAPWIGAWASRARDGTTDGAKGMRTHQSSPPSTWPEWTSSHQCTSWGWGR